MQDCRKRVFIRTSSKDEITGKFGDQDEETWKVTADWMKKQVYSQEEQIWTGFLLIWKTEYNWYGCAFRVTTL